MYKRQILETGSIPGLVRGVALTAAIYAVGALSTLGYTQTLSLIHI